MLKSIPVAVMTFAAPVAYFYAPTPQPAVLVTQADMPQSLPKTYDKEEPAHANEAKAVALFYQLKKDFAISHTTMAEWLGVKRRTLYNWINSPLKSRQYSDQIENRLAALSELKDEMEPEHFNIIHKIAFSPIYGDRKLGELILNGTPSVELIECYEKLFSLFETYRKLKVSKSSTV